MSKSITCRELGMECPFRAEEDSEENLVQSLIRHVTSVHTDDWFELEEIHEIAISRIREKAA